MPCDYKRYPADWTAIRARILKRAWNKCEQCGRHNYAIIVNDIEREHYPEFQNAQAAARAMRNHFPDAKTRIVVLTIAHLDHDVAHNDDSNLRAWCQKCHLAHDKELHIRHGKETKVRKNAEKWDRLQRSGHGLFSQVRG